MVSTVRSFYVVAVKCDKVDLIHWPQNEFYSELTVKIDVHRNNNYSLLMMSKTGDADENIDC